MRNELIVEGLGNRLGGGEGGRGAVVIRSVCYRKGSNKRGALYVFIPPSLSTHTELCVIFCNIDSNERPQ